MDKERFKKTCIQESEKKGSIHLRHMRIELHAETGCRRVDAGKVFE